MKANDISIALPGSYLRPDSFFPDNFTSHFNIKGNLQAVLT